MGNFMGKTISLKLTSKEEMVVDQILKQGVSPSELLREALFNYFSLVNQKVDRALGEEVYQKVDQVDQKVNLIQQEKIGYKVNQKVDRLMERAVYQKVDQVDQLNKYLNLYIDQLNTRVHQLSGGIQEWKNKYTTEVQYLKDSYSSLQTEYHNQVKDSVKRIDDKFDRIMFYLEESRKPTPQTVDIKPELKAESDKIAYDVHKVRKKKVTEKPKKGWVFQMFRM